MENVKTGLILENGLGLCPSDTGPHAWPISKESESREMKLNTYPVYNIEAYQSWDDLTTIHFPDEQIST